MMAPEKSPNLQRLSFEAAIDEAGFGLYSYTMTFLTGICIIAYACITYGSTFIVPTSACELSLTASQQGIMAAGPVVGLSVGGVGWGYLADTRGRRPMLILSLVASSFVNILATLSVNWVMLLVLQFIAAVTASGIYSISMTLLSESVPMAKRNICVMLVSSIFLMAQGIMAVLAMPIIPLRFSHYLSALDIYWNSWRTLLLVYSLPNLFTAVLLCFVPESPKFVFIKGDKNRALDILRTIHKFNHLRSKEELQVKDLLKEDTSTLTSRPSAKDQIVPLFKAPYLKYTLIMTSLYLFQQLDSFLIWLPTIADQFFRSIQTGENSDFTLCQILSIGAAPADPDATPCALDDTSMLAVLGVSAILSIFNMCICMSINLVGRRNIVMFMALLCGVSGILVNLVPSVVASALLFIVMVQAIIVLGLYTAIAVALFPTHLRAMAISLTMSGGRVGTFASIQILKLMLANHCSTAFYVFSSIFVSSAVIASLLPDDRPRKTPAPLPVKSEPKEHPWEAKIVEFSRL